MSVLLPDGAYRVARRAYPWPQDAHGAPVPPEAGPYGPPRPGAAKEQPRTETRLSRSQPEGTYRMRLDPAEWPVREGDRVTGPGGRTWTITSFPQLYTNPVLPYADYISAWGTMDLPPGSIPYEAP